MRLIIDCNYLAYRSLFTMVGLSHDEKQVGVIFGFIKQILKLAEQFNTNQFIFCWDSKQSYRKLIYPEYKAGRHKEMTEQEEIDFQLAYGQFDELRDNVLPYMGFNNIFHQTGYEADDLIAWIVMRFPDDTMIVSADNDLFQLIHHDRFCPVRMWNFKIINDEQRFSADWNGLKPTDWIKVKAIAGCTSDNIPGIPGVGEITAAKYIAGTLTGKKLETIELWERTLADTINMNYRLVGLPFSGKKPIRITGIQDDSISEDKFKACFGQYGFRSLLNQDLSMWFGGQDGGQPRANPVRKIQR